MHPLPIANVLEMTRRGRKRGRGEYVEGGAFPSGRVELGFLCLCLRPCQPLILPSSVPKFEGGDITL